MIVINSIYMVSFYFKYIVSSNFYVVIDRMLGTPRHENYGVDSINSCNKYCLMGKYV